VDAATDEPGRSAPWRTSEVWAIALSAFFADSGYQAVLAGFPLFLVIALRQPVWEFGLASAVSYGGGALFSLAGGRIGDRIGHRRLALIGNAAIPLLSLSALVANPAWAIGLLSGGWWARNLRSPSRRVMLSEAVPEPSDRVAAFGFLHGLDVGGGVLAGVFVLAALAGHVAFRWIFLATALPLVVSTGALWRARTGRLTGHRSPPVGGSASNLPETGKEAPAASGAPHGGVPGSGVPGSPAGAERQAPAPGEHMPGRRSLVVAGGLYGFTLYSVGFPVLTVAQGSGRLLAGIGAFLILQVASAATGFFVAGRFRTALAGQFFRLGLFGYLGGGIGAAVLAVGAAAHGGLGVLYVGVAIVGIGLGMVETLEPAAMSVVGSGSNTGRGFASLAASRSLGTFVANLAMGLLYGIGAGAAYGYAAAVAVVAAGIVLSAVPKLAASSRTPGRRSS